MQADRVTQLGLFPDVRPQLLATPELVGRNAGDILTLILEHHKDITHGECVTYPFLFASGYDITPENTIYPLTRDQLQPANLELLSGDLNIHMWSYSTGKLDELGHEIVYSDPRIVALSSRVKAGGLYMQIPMLDFAPIQSGDYDREKGNVLTALSELGTSGYLLNSGNSFHFWGLNLILPDKWDSMMTDIRDDEEGRRKAGIDPIYDYGFIDSSINRGFAALRIVGYPPNKSEPRIIAVVN